MSAVLPPKATPRPSKPKLSLAPPAAAPDAPGNSDITPTATRPALRLPALAVGLSNLRLDDDGYGAEELPSAGVTMRPASSAYGSSYGGRDEDRDSWAAEHSSSAMYSSSNAQARMTGELRAAIRGDSASDLDLLAAEADVNGGGASSGGRARSSSRSTRPRGPRRPSVNAEDGDWNGQPSVQAGYTKLAVAGSCPVQDDGQEEDELFDVDPDDLEDIKFLGEGASGAVRKVLHRPTGILMAKKSIATSPDQQVHRQHLRELAFNRECAHPNITKYYGAFLEQNDTQIGLCMEFAEGGSLDTIYREKLRPVGARVSEKVLAKIAESVLQGLVYLHERRIIHRDIKPSNILVTGKGQFKLCDFGVSGELVNSFATTYVGSNLYMAPERIQGAPYSIKSDVWSLGITLLEVAMNKFPFPAEGEPPLNNPIDILQYVMSMGPPPMPDEGNVKWTNAFRDFIKETLIKDSVARPSPQKLLGHPWIKRSQQADRQPDLESWVAQVNALGRP